MTYEPKSTAMHVVRPVVLVSGGDSTVVGKRACALARYRTVSAGKPRSEKKDNGPHDRTA